MANPEIHIVSGSKLNKILMTSTVDEQITILEDNRIPYILTGLGDKKKPVVLLSELQKGRRTPIDKSTEGATEPRIPARLRQVK